ncbi:hypothetical protein BCR39DRAFT_518090 [Naematelia encephala]|uniref:Peptidase S9 prolyl oligopeptidase catalytic domain-containing protein n=1 Tax=Naematelia encephala TaxID=71784 RepID=A0A1Y2BGQ4_9TREE|nr:hypothetical protein BCR39DRAFT_518090 [Naematelia encephala]
MAGLMLSSGMREHPFTGSPLAAFLDPSADPDVDFARRKYDQNETWPSELTFGGRAGWEVFETGENGWTEISYPKLNWDQLRSDHGWASLQYESIVRTTLAVPKVGSSPLTPILVEVIQGVEYAFVPVQGPLHGPIQWYAGDVYAFADTQYGTRLSRGSTSNFARSIALVPGEYVVLVRALYEIRMFGDPGPSKPPVIRFRVAMVLDDTGDLEVVTGLTEIPDLIDGKFMGDWISLVVRRPDGLMRKKVEVRNICMEIEGETLDCEVVDPVRVWEGQTRPLAVRLHYRNQGIPKSADEVKITLSYSLNNGPDVPITFLAPLRHLSTSTQPLPPFKITFPAPLLPASGPPAYISFAMVVPPVDILETRSTPPPPVILASHGAGVDITWASWNGSMPVRPGGWAVLPTGKNEWGEDWHGGSMLDVWAAREAFARIVQRIGVNPSEETLLIGHSNGGQGAWHIAARYPDRIVGIIAASGYLKVQDYVPYIKLTSHHYADPALMGILMSALTPYNNDLYSSNLAHIPIMAVHGSVDTNVTPRHGRAQVGLIASWEGQHDKIRLLEVPGEYHWWDEIFRQPAVSDWIHEVQSQKRRTWEQDRKEGFTLTTANPDETGGRAGIRIVELDTPGRLARLDVNARQWKGERTGDGLDLRGMNIKRIEVVSAERSSTLVNVKGKGFVEDTESIVPHPPAPIRAYGPIIRLLATSGPITFVIGNSELHLDIVKRLAHDLFLYHRVDTRILDAMEALGHTARGTLGEGSVIVLGRPEDNEYAKWILGEGKIPVEFPTKGIMTVANRLVYEKSTGIITLHPHPTAPKSLACLIAGNDDEGLELAARLFPIRTGVPLPDWVIVGARSKWMGAGGFVGAGFWDGEWKWNEAMSWIDR